jgi:hypothetical protein
LRASYTPRDLALGLGSDGGDPDGLAPEQWHDRLRPASAGELRLMAAVMADAIRDLRMHGSGTPSRVRHLGRLAKQWIDARDRSWPYSFENICCAFEIDPAMLRRQLARERNLNVSPPVRDRSPRNLVLTGPAPLPRRRRTPRDPLSDADRSRAVA